MSHSRVAVCVFLLLLGSEARAGIFSSVRGLVHDPQHRPVEGAQVTLRAFWGRYYQPPPLVTVSGPLLDLAAEEGFGFLPLRGERDEQREFGLSIPLAGWNFDVSNFRTSAKNYFDHDALGNSNIFFPLTIERARIRGWEVTGSSPRIASRIQVHLAYSQQYAEGSGGVTGGLTDFAPPEGGYFFLNHDQRDTLAAGANLDLARRTPPTKCPWGVPWASRGSFASPCSIFPTIITCWTTAIPWAARTMPIRAKSPCS
jgi:hypothetical protein